MADEIVARYRAEVEQALRNLRELEKANEGVGKSSQNASSGLSQMGNAAQNMGRQVLGALGITAGIAGLVNVVRSGVNTMREFEQQMAKVKAVSGATADEMKRLEGNAKALGSSTKFTATQVGQLQEEYARLGFTSTEILAATEATLNLAAATGESLASAAEVAGSTVRGFGLSATETTRVTDVMAKSFSLSALNLERFRESIKLVAPIARAANIDLETTTALLGQLANAGLSGSIAGTALKNLLSKLSDGSSDLSKTLGFTVKSSEDLFRAFSELSKKNIDLTQATELTDERSKAAFITLFNGIKTVDDLKVALKGAAGSAKAMADIMSDTLEGDILAVESAWEGLILTLGKTDKIRGAAKLILTLLDAMNKSYMDAKDFFELFDLAENVNNASIAAQKYAAELAESDNAQALLNEKIAETKKKIEELEAARAKYNVKEEYSKRGATQWENYRTDVEELSAALKVYEEELDRLAGKDDPVKTKEQIRNIFFLTREIIRLKEIRDAEGTSREKILEINKQLKPLEEDLAFLQGKMADNTKEANDALVEYLATVEKFNRGIQIWQDKQLEIIDAQTDIDRLYTMRTVFDADERANALTEIEKERLRKRIELLKSFGRDSMSEQLKLEQMEIDGREQLMKEMAALEKRFRDGMDEDYNNSLEYRKKKLEEFTEFEAEMRAQQLELYNGFSNFITQTIGQISQYEQQEAQKRYAIVDDLLERQIISEEEASKRKRKIARDEAKKNKELAIFSAIVGTAQAVVNAMATAPNYIVGAIFAALAGIAGAVQIATIENEPLPQFGKGGWVKGKKHREGGEVIEAEGGEFIIAAQRAQPFKGLLEAINEGKVTPDKVQGWQGLKQSLELNGIGSFSDRNLLSAIDRHREGETSLLSQLLHEVKKSNGRPMRGGYHA